MIQLEDLAVSFGAHRAVDGVSLDIQEGSMVGLLGPNGAGKTTTLRCVAGLQVPTTGRVRVGGLDVAVDPRATKHLLGFVPQTLALYPTLSVRKNLRLFGGLFGLAGPRLKDRVDWGLSLSRLQAKADAKVATLSGGMKRRLNLAAALLHNPPIIVCDEPTTGVDPQSRQHLFDMIRQLHAGGCTVIYTTHYMEEVEALCQRVVIMDCGRVIADDSLEHLLGTPAASAAYQLRLSAPVDAELVVAALAAGGLAVEELGARRRDLEQVFLDLTGRGLRDGAAVKTGLRS